MFHIMMTTTLWAFEWDIGTVEHTVKVSVSILSSAKLQCLVVPQLGAATLRHALRNSGMFSVLETPTPVAKCRTVETGCSRSIMYDKALPMSVRWTSRHNLNCMHASTSANKAQSLQLKHGHMNVGHTQVSRQH